MRILSLIVTLPFSLFIIWFAVSNRSDVAVSLDYLELQYTAPLFVFICIAFIIGFFIGAIFIQFKRLKDKISIRTLTKANERLLNEVAKLTDEKTALESEEQKKLPSSSEKPFFFNKASDIIPFRRKTTKDTSL